MLQEIISQKNLNKKELSSLINNISVAVMMDLTYLGKVAISKLYRNNPENKVYQQKHELKNNKILGTYHLGKFVNIVNDDIEYGEQKDSCYYNINHQHLSGQERSNDNIRVSSLLCQINLLEPKIKNLLELISNITTDLDSNSSLNTIFKNVINKKFTNFENLNNVNYPIIYDLISQLDFFVKIYNQEVKNLIDGIKKYDEFKMRLAEKYNKSPSFISRNLNIPIVNNSKKIRSEVTKLFQAFEKVNAFNYLENILNKKDNLDNFYDGYIDNKNKVIKLVYHNSKSKINQESYQGSIIELNNNIDINLSDDFNGQIGFNSELYNTKINKEASLSATSIMPIYLYIIKKELCKNIVEFIYNNKDKPDSKSNKVFQQVDEYITKTNLYLDEKEKDPIKLSLVGALSNELLNDYTKYILAKYSSALVLKGIRSDINLNTLVKDDQINNKPVMVNTKQDFTNTLNKPSSNLIKEFLKKKKIKRFSIHLDLLMIQ